MPKKNQTQKILEKIYDYSLEDIMGERFAIYSKYIIQDRAIPDARDGLKPVQRRILYSMNKEKNTYDKPYRKSAKTVGDAIGNYHPHGDSSIYDAMVRMSQDWKIKEPYIDMHGNNGSIDGDGPAAYRYTEARLSKISSEMVKDIDKNTVEFAPNFDDSLLEPTVLPARFPALLVNGSTGISAGYATNIPPHNLGEVIDATIHRIEYPNCSLETLMKDVKGPDFPTGAIVEGLDGIKEAYEIGRGRIVIKSKAEIINEKGQNAIIITEIPYETNKAMIVKKIDDIRLDKKIDGIVEVRDESAKDIRIVIDLKKDAKAELVLAYLYKNTDLQVSYHFNMIAIASRRPKLLGLIGALDAFINHQREVVTRRSRFDLDHANARYHIVEGLIKCISILDEVIRVIRASKNKADARENLVKEFDFTMEQAEAIVMLQLYKLTNTDVTLLEEELENLRKIIAGLSAILNDEEVLKKVMIEDLRKVKKEYATPRKSEIHEEIEDIKIDTMEMIAKEDVVVSLSSEGYIKRSSLRSYQASLDEGALKEGDYLFFLKKMNTQDVLLVFTNKGNYLYIPVHMIYDMKWKDLGKHVSNLVPMEEGEIVIGAYGVSNFDTSKSLIFVSHCGMIKRTLIKDMKLTRYSKTTCCMKLKGDDELLTVIESNDQEIFLSTRHGYGLWFDQKEIPIVGVKAAGVKGINLKDDFVVSCEVFEKDTTKMLAVFTDKGTGKRIRLTDFEKTSRARRGLLLLREVKTNPYHVVQTLLVDARDKVGIKNGDVDFIKVSDLPIMDRYSTGSTIHKKTIDKAFALVTLSDLEDQQEQDEVKELPKKEQISLEDIDQKLMSVDDYLKEK